MANIEKVSLALTGEQVSALKVRLSIKTKAKKITSRP
jgi:hypothetical protein